MLLPLMSHIKNRDLLISITDNVFEQGYLFCEPNTNIYIYVSYIKQGGRTQEGSFIQCSKTTLFSGDTEKLRMIGNTWDTYINYLNEDARKALDFIEAYMSEWQMEI